MKKYKVLFAIIGLFFVLVTIFFIFDKTHYVMLNDEKIYSISEIANAEQKLFEEYKQQNLYFEDQNINDLFVTYSYENELNNISAFNFFMRKIKQNHANITFKTNIKREKFKNYILEHNASAKSSKNAYILEVNGSYQIITEVYGNKINTSKLFNDLNNGFIHKLENYYELPTIKEEDLKQKLDEINHFVLWQCQYENGYIVSSNVDCISVDENYNISLNDEFLDKAILELKEKYNTTNKNYAFTTHNGEEIEIPNKTWGLEIDCEKELKYLKNLFKSGNKENNRFPFLVSDRENIGGTYVEVSVEEQCCWVYQDGEIVLETDIVTGQLGKHDTPLGVYYISECIDGKYLVGDGYKTWVDKWMRITDRGHGLHDASWRSKFGGEIYTYDGSHGCINMPKKIAYQLFDIAYVGMPVVIY